MTDNTPTLDKPENTVWCVFRELSLDSAFSNQDAAQERADYLSGTGIEGVLIEPYRLYNTIVAAKKALS